jgi:hypothetical protein
LIVKATLTVLRHGEERIDLTSRLGLPTVSPSAFQLQEYTGSRRVLRRGKPLGMGISSMATGGPISSESTTKPAGERSDSRGGHDYKLERYKFLLEQISFVNENSFRMLTLYQTLATAILGAGVALFVGRSELGIDPETARLGLRSLIGLLLLVTLFVVLSIGAGLVTWIDYRNEEADLLNNEVAPGFRERPKLRNIWRWYESQFALAPVVVFLAVWAFVELFIIPKVQDYPPSGPTEAGPRVTNKTR